VTEKESRDLKRGNAPASLHYLARREQRRRGGRKKRKKERKERKTENPNMSSGFRESKLHNCERSEDWKSIAARSVVTHLR